MLGVLLHVKKNGQDSTLTSNTPSVTPMNNGMHISQRSFAGLHNDIS